MKDRLTPIKAARLQTGKSLEEVAASARVAVRSLYRWERGDGEPSAQALVRLAAFFRTYQPGLRADDLVSPEEPAA